MKKGFLLTIVLLYIMAWGQDCFAQANRERKTAQKEAYVEKEAVVCMCVPEGIKIVTWHAVQDSYPPEIEYDECPNCKTSWYFQYTNNKLQGPYRRHKVSKHECDRNCIRVRVNPAVKEQDRLIEISRQQTCDMNSIVYIVFTGWRKIFILDSGMSKGRFHIKPKEPLSKYTLINDIPDKYIGYAIIEDEP